MEEEDEIRRRIVHDEHVKDKGDELIEDSSKPNQDDVLPETGSGEDLESIPTLIETKDIPQGTDASFEFLNSFLNSIPSKWRNYTVRFITTCLMIGVFALLVYLGPMALVFLVILIQLMCFNEIINIGYIVYKSQDLPWFRTLSWFFLFTSNYFLFGEGLIGNFRILLAKETQDQINERLITQVTDKDLLQSLVTHHRFISFCLYCCGIVWFVLSLVKKHYLQQFTLFGWTHVTLLIIVTSSHFIMNNIFNGIIWFLVPVSMIICNDIMAYMFGFFFGRTPLIKLSPKKTWEGFIGGGISTLIFAIFFAKVLISYDYFVCPLEYDDVKGALSMECVRNPVFRPVTYELPSYFSFIPVSKVTLYPYFKHCIIMALFSSVVGPFGGFFASGFKRAFKIKDFGDLIPGHGGIMDRFDCQVLMGAFVYFYYNSFIRIPSPNSLLQQIFTMPRNDQLDFYQRLAEGLVRRGILPG